MNMVFNSPWQTEIWVSENGFVYYFLSGGPSVFVDMATANDLLNNPLFSVAGD